MTAILIRKPGVEPIDFRLTLWLRHPAVGGFAAHTNTNVQMLRPLFGAAKLHI